MEHGSPWEGTGPVKETGATQPRCLQPVRVVPARGFGTAELTWRRATGAPGQARAAVGSQAVSSSPPPRMASICLS